MSLVLRDVELAGLHRTDVTLSERSESTGPGLVTSIGAARPRPGDTVVEGGGGALLPGLADRHLHLMGLAAARDSLDCGPPAVLTAEALGAALRGRAAARAPGTWLRGVGYHESAAGHLDRDRLHALAPHVPLRVQHRTGALWILSDAAVDLLGLDAPGALPEGAERDADGRFTGRLWREDPWLRARLGRAAEPDLGAVGRLLAGYGVTALTDATPGLDDSTVRALSRAAVDGRLPQRITLLGARTADHVVPAARSRLGLGPFKLLPPDHDLWDYDEFAARVREARGPNGRRPVAVHCVTREALVLTLIVLRETGAVPGDRIEHAAVVPPELHTWLRELGVRVVTQPAFVAERGDSYLADVAPEDVPHLYPYASLLAAGVPVSAASDAPYATPDPWAVMRAARDRRTPSGKLLSPAERVDVPRVLAGLLGRPAIRPGDPADLCLLHVGLREALAAPDASLVRLTLCDGRLVSGAGTR